MEEENKEITRREAIKRIGTAAVGFGLGVGGATALGNVFGNSYNDREMKVLLVNGSPHKEGCTYTALSEIASTLSKNGVESDFMWLGTSPIAGCIACGSCRQTGKCFRNDVVNEFIDKIPEYDGFIFGTPVHFASATGAMTAFMDRAFFAGSFHGKKLAGKPGATIASCRRAGSTATLDQMNKYIVFSNMPMVPSQYWNMVHGNTPDEVREDKEGLQIMRTLGQNMAWLLKCIEAGRQLGIEPPIYEDFTPTNFIR